MEETLQRQETAYNQTVGQPTIVMSNSATPFYPAHKFLAPLQIDPYGDMLYQEDSNAEKVQRDLEKAINVNKMQHHYITNLQRANLYLKSRIKELEEVVNLYKSSAANATFAQRISQLEKEISLGNGQTSSGTKDDYKLVSIG